MKTILVPTDFSQDAHDSLLYAIDIARLANCQIVLFHAFYQPISFPYERDFTTVVNELERRHTQKLEAYASEVRLAMFDHFSLDFHSTGTTGVGTPGEPMTRSGLHTVALDKAPEHKAEVPIRRVCKFGFAFDEILKAVDVHAADLIVMGMRGESLLRRALLGRTTINVMRDAEVPVLAVPLDARFNGFESVVFAADLFKLPSDAVLGMLRNLVQLFHSRLQVLHLYHQNSLETEQERALHALDQLDCQLQGIDYKVVFQKEEDIAEGVKEFVREQRAELLVLIPQKHLFLEKLLNKSLTQKLLAKAFVPVLALPYGVVASKDDAPKVVEEKY